MSDQAVLHYHRCRCCDKDCICSAENCSYRASDKEREWVCFRCIDSGKALIDQFVAGISTERLRAHRNGQKEINAVGTV